MTVALMCCRNINNNYKTIHQRAGGPIRAPIVLWLYDTMQFITTVLLKEPLHYVVAPAHVIYVLISVMTAANIKHVGERSTLVVLMLD